MDWAAITYTWLVETLKRGMRRFVILFLLVLLPIEVLAGIAYEQRLALEAQHEANEHHERASADDPALPTVLASAYEQAGAQDHVQPGSAVFPTFDFGESDFSLDLGEAFDVPSQSHPRSARHAASRPVHASFSDTSIVVAVPVRPAI